MILKFDEDRWHLLTPADDALILPVSSKRRSSVMDLAVGGKLTAGLIDFFFCVLGNYEINTATVDL